MNLKRANVYQAKSSLFIKIVVNFALLLVKKLINLYVSNITEKMGIRFVALFLVLT